MRLGHLAFDGLGNLYAEDSGRNRVLMSRKEVSLGHLQTLVQLVISEGVDFYDSSCGEYFSGRCNAGNLDRKVSDCNWKPKDDLAICAGPTTLDTHQWPFPGSDLRIASCHFTVREAVDMSGRLVTKVLSASKFRKILK